MTASNRGSRDARAPASPHAAHEKSMRLKPIKDPLHRLRLALNDARSRAQPPPPDPGFCVGLAKAGTHTVTEVMATGLRSAHEPEPHELIGLLARARAGQLPLEEARELFEWRQRRLRLQFESSHLLGAFVPQLVEIFPESRFLLLVRDCRAWINSMINDELYVRSTPGYPMWRVVFEQYLGPAGGCPPEERVLEELELAPLECYVAFWTGEITSIMDAVPSGRLLVVRTEDLSREVATVAGFFGMPAPAPGAPHSYRAAGTRDVLAGIDPGHLDRVLARAAPVTARVAAACVAGGRG